jgi:serine/threonine protein phosphatase PrpC
VSQWSEIGVDSRLYAEKLKNGLKYAYEKQKSRNTFELLEYAWEAAKEVTGTRYDSEYQKKKSVKFNNSSTACIAVIEGNCLSVTNLGDSGTL